MKKKKLIPKMRNNSENFGMCFRSMCMAIIRGRVNLLKMCTLDKNVKKHAFSRSRNR